MVKEERKEKGLRGGRGKTRSRGEEEERWDVVKGREGKTEHEEWDGGKGWRMEEESRGSERGGGHGMKIEEFEGAMMGDKG